jgi:hypothetical protein
MLLMPAGHATVPLSDIEFTDLRMKGLCIDQDNYLQVGKFQISNAENVCFTCLSNWVSLEEKSPAVEA